MGIPWETVTLTAFGRNKQLYYDILEDGTFNLTSDSLKMLLMWDKILVFTISTSIYYRSCTCITIVFFFS